MISRRVWWFAAVVAASLPQTATAQVTWTSGWVVSAAPQIDLWYHALATIGFQRHAALSPYDRDHLRAAGIARRQLGLREGELERKAADLRSDLAERPSFEFLHIVPALFPHATPERMLDAIRRAMAGADAGDSEPEVALGIDRLSRRFRTNKERKVIREMAELIEREWHDFYGAYWRGDLGSRASYAHDVQQAIDRLLQSRIAVTLGAWRLQSGRVFVAAPVGIEGRVFTGEEGNPSDNVVIVGAPGQAEQAAFAFLRELCYAHVGSFISELRVGRGDAYVAEQARGRAAVRCGALLLELHLGEWLTAYRDYFVGADDVTPDEFAAVFAIDELLLARIARDIERAR